ncbi:BREX-1 system adenine-specific DNA-methyltransferase PglX [Pseudomonas sp. D1-1]|uniref:BREX-1 system adenine-specific DNA-methyltransferase PglX n=1 Tax=Pseudomonas sp. D1-1 TaxID=1040793 RepID=UPI003DA7A9C5
MAFDQSTRGRLQKLVNTCRSLLSEEFSIQLQQAYGLDPKTGDVTPMARLIHLDDRQRHTAQVLRQTLAHYLGADADDTDHRIAVLDRVVREQAFTVLNRLAALLMMEARGQLIESVSKGYQSRGYQLYSKIAGNALGETGQAYQVYLFSVFDELTQELPALFDRYAANGLLFPRETALRAVLGELNHFEVEPLWAEDETIGWIYQYFNSKEERKAMRDASQAPRNSRELAVRNQFFTPRYVVEFLVDNTLGRLWFNDTGGQTELRDRCQYLLVKPDEQPQASSKVRDPRTLKLLDPACGSMHFGLYAFDLFLEIYRETWAWEQQNGPGSLDVSTQPQAALKPLCRTYEDEAAFTRDLPRLIIEHNIYGVDIDPRAAQIASLALWLRAQRAWHEAGVKAKDRPRIGQGHVVAAVAPPAERELRHQFAANLDQRDAELFEKTLQLLKGLPELGVLLQVEHELPSLIRQVYVGKGTGLFAEQEQESWLNAEARLRAALTEFTQASHSTYQGRLFAQDALQGLRLIDLCSEVFDVVVMNPPFGDGSTEWSGYLSNRYGKHANNLFCTFIARAISLSKLGFVGAITDNTWLKKTDYEDLRELVLDGDLQLANLVDLGWGVLDDANVAACAFTLSALSTDIVNTLDLQESPLDEKGDLLRTVVSQFSNPFSLKEHPSAPQINSVDRRFFDNFPGKAIAHEAPPAFVSLFTLWPGIDPSFCKTRRGYTPGDTFRFFRLWWEVSSDLGAQKWWTLNNGGAYSPIITDGLLVGYRDDGWSQYRPLSGFRLESEQWFGKPGIGWGKRTDYMYAYPLPAGSIFSHEGHCAFPTDDVYLWPLLAYLNSSLGQQLLNLFCGQHKLAGYVSNLPCPPLNSEELRLAGDAAKECWEAASKISRTSEQSEIYNSPFSKIAKPWEVNKLLSGWVDIYFKKIAEIDRLVDKCAAKATNISSFSSSGDDRPRAFVEKFCTSYDWARELVSYLFGCAVGRWSVGEFDSDLENLCAGNPFEKINYHFLDVDARNVVLVDDPGAPLDASGLIRSYLRKIWNEDADVIESAILEHIGEESLRSYLVRPNGFFADHRDRYSKGRRSAPVYWPLSTASGSYTLWVYYPSLSNQTLFSAVNDFLDGPNGKLTQVSRECAELRITGSGRSRDEEKQYETLQTFEQELTDLRDNLLKIAPTFQPNHDDGVQITAAPLWPLFRHKPWQKVLKDTWGKLEKGDYDWARLATAYWPERVREKCKNDKSLAIAHGLEELYVEPEAAPKKTRGKKKAGGEE